MQLTKQFSPVQLLLISVSVICTIVLVALLTLLQIRKNQTGSVALVTTPVEYTQPEKTEWREQVPDFPIEVNTIPITNNEFGLPRVELKNATREARFKNMDAVSHTVISDRGESLSFTLDSQQEKTILLPDQGTFIFFLNSIQGHQIRVSTF